MVAFAPRGPRVPLADSFRRPWVRSRLAQTQITAVRRPLGAVPLEEGLVEFRVWAPAAEAATVRVGDRDHALE